MIKIWIAADFLGQAERAGGAITDVDRADLTEMIQLSNNEIAHRLYQQGGGDALIRRAIDTCGLANTTISPGVAITG